MILLKKIQMEKKIPIELYEI